MSRPVLGIDPGKGGAIALYRADGSLRLHDVPVLEIGGRRQIDYAHLALIVDDIAKEAPDAAIELVGPRPHDGHVGAFDFGRTFGLMIGLVAAHHMPITFYAPVKWKRAVGIPAGADKDVSRQRASALMPRHADQWPLKKHDGRAEAALIAYHAFTTAQAARTAA